MLKKITWEVATFHLLPFVLGLVAIITVAVKYKTAPNGEYTPALALGCGLFIASVGSFIFYLFSKHGEVPPV